MKIASVRIENFRSFKDSTIQFNDFACLVGPNGSGKSTILIALSVFFREYENIPTNLHQLGIEDFHRKNTNKPIKITVTFKDLSSEAASDFAGYVRHGQLIVSAEATYNKETGKAEVKQYGQRLGMPDFAPFFKAVGEGKRVAELKELYNGLRETYDDLPGSGTKAAMQGALQVYEADNPGRCVPIPSEDQFYGFSRGANRLAKHVQWVYVPAVKDASGEQVEARNSALGRLLSRTVRLKTRFVEELATLRTNTQDQYQELLNDNQGALDEISKSLERRLRVWAHPRARMQLQWRQDSDKSVRVEEPWAHIVAGEGGFDGELARFGHGLQRSFLFALLQELADTDDSSAPTLILACEEPELYQHPPQARHLAFVLDNLSRDHSQVIVTTHSPFFVSVSRESFEDVRMVRKDSDRNYSVVAYTSFEEIAKDVEEVSTRPTRPEGVLAMIHQALQPALTEMFFTRRLILVEGLEDIAYILSYIRLLDKSEEFRQLGCHMCQQTGRANYCNLSQSQCALESQRIWFLTLMRTRRI